MTTVACNLREMAADSLVTVEGARPYHTAKIYRLPDGSVAGVCGSGYEEVMNWLLRGELDGNQPKGGDGDWQILRLTSSGLLLYTNSWLPDKLKQGMFAIGSGSQVALYAMRHLKKTPAAAVREAMKMDPSTGGPVDTIKLRSK